MRRNALNLDTHHNVFCCGPLLHHYFDINEWLLLPEVSIIKEFESSIDSSRVVGQHVPLRENFPVFPV
jgi:hypothetical protein